MLSGPMAQHMAMHIVLMNVLAPVVALVLHRRLQPPAMQGIAAATLLQIVLLWFWHAPPLVEAARLSLTLQGLSQAMLFGAALLFWRAVLAQPGLRRWRALFALLVTGKAFCLLGALLVFAQHPLFPVAGTDGPEALADQQLAGLLMLTACPIVYVLAALPLAAQWLTALHTQSARAPEARAHS